MELKREYHDLLARVLAGEDEEEGGVGAAALGRRLAENDVSAADVARIHAAAIEQHIAAEAADQRALALLRGSRLLAEVMRWCGLAACLLNHQRAAEAELRRLGQEVCAHTAGAPAQEASASRYTHAEAISFLEGIAVTDSLTGVYNARHFNIALQARVAAAREAMSVVSLLMVDVDGLGRYNEAYGRRQGDNALTTVARLLMENTRRSDFVARCGGDEFAVILPDCTTRQALALAERIRRVVEEHGLPDALTVSVGIATFPTDAVSDRELVNVTQQACYLAQRLGGNTVCTALLEETEATPDRG